MNATRSRKAVPRRPSTGFLREGPRRSSAARWIALISTLSTLALVGCEATESIGNPNRGTRAAIKVSVIEVTPGAMRDALRLPGETEARRDVTLAAERDGRVEWIGPREGDSVKKGQLIAKVDTATLKAVLDRCEASHKLAEEKAERRRQLNERKIVPQEALEEAETQRLQAACNLREAKVKYEQGFLRSPIDGVVNARFVDPGEFVNRGSSVVEVVDVDRIRINVNVPEMDVRFLKKWQTVKVTVDAYPDRSWEGMIDFVAYKADRATKTFKVRVVVDNEDGLIRPGMIAHVSFQRRLIPDALAVPLTAIIDKGGERYVFVEKDGIAHERSVEIGIIEGDRVQIVGGIRPGENLIVVGQHEVEQGTRVAVQ